MARASDQEPIRRLVAGWVAAVQAQDMDGVLAAHADDIVMFDVPLPPQSKGLTEYKKTWTLFFDNNPPGRQSFRLTELDITVGDTVAFCHAILHVFDAQGRLTMGLRKEDGHWLIAHEHHSYPAE